MTHDAPQGTAEWRAVRLGKATASRMGDLTAKTKTGYGASRANYLSELVLERIVGVPSDHFETPAMRRGTELEPEARRAYEMKTELWVVEVGFMEHHEIPMAGASCDGLVSADGLVEIKCLGAAGHLDLLLGGGIPCAYTKQMQFQMAVTGRQWCDLAAYHPGFPPHLQLLIKRVYHDDAMISELEAETLKFLAEIDDKLMQLGRLAA